MAEYDAMRVTKANPAGPRKRRMAMKNAPANTAAPSWAASMPALKPTRLSRWFFESRPRLVSAPAKPRPWINAQLNTSARRQAGASGWLRAFDQRSNNAIPTMVAAMAGSTMWAGALKPPMTTAASVIA